MHMHSRVHTHTHMYLFTHEYEHTHTQSEEHSQLYALAPQWRGCSLPSCLRTGSHSGTHFCPSLRTTYRCGLSDDTDPTYLADSHSAPPWQTMAPQPFLSSPLSVPQPACLLYAISTKIPLSLHFRLDILLLDMPFLTLYSVPHTMSQSPHLFLPSPLVLSMVELRVGYRGKLQ